MPLVPKHIHSSACTISLLRISKNSDSLTSRYVGLSLGGILPEIETYPRFRYGAVLLEARRLYDQSPPNHRSTPTVTIIPAGPLNVSTRAPSWFASASTMLVPSPR